MAGLKLIGWAAIIFGILVLLLPNLLNYLVAIFFVIVGINILMFGRQFRG